MADISLGQRHRHRRSQAAEAWDNGLISPHHLSHGFFCWPGRAGCLCSVAGPLHRLHPVRTLSNGSWLLEILKASLDTSGISSTNLLKTALHSLRNETSWKPGPASFPVGSQPPKELTHLLLVREAKVFNGTVRIVLTASQHSPRLIWKNATLNIPKSTDSSSFSFLKLPLTFRPTHLLWRRRWPAQTLNIPAGLLDGYGQLSHSIGVQPIAPAAQASRHW